MSVGMTPAGIRKIFCVEALVIAGRPLLITLPLTIAFVQFAAAASHLNPVSYTHLDVYKRQLLSCRIIRRQLV